jgi:hypothetical protein
MAAPSLAPLALPLRVFLSYSHRDEEWKEGLKRALASLSTNGYITIWDDRKIPAGTAWEDQIETELASAAITLLLISENYLNSGYCRGERDLAIERQRRHPETARVIPLFVQRVALIQSDPLLSLQGLPRDMKWADDWSAHEQNKPRSLIAEGILEEVYALSGHGRQAATPREPAASPRLAPKFVDRDTQEREFKDFWDVASWSRPAAAQIYLLPALDIDYPDYFIQRLREDTVERLARSFKGPHKASTDPIVVEREPRYTSLDLLQHDLSRDLFEAFGATWDPSCRSAKRLAALDRVRRYAFIVIEQTISADAAGPLLPELVSWYANTFWAGFSSETHFLVFIHLCYRVPEIPRRSRLLSWLPFSSGLSASSRPRLFHQLKQILPEGRANLLPDAPGVPLKLLPGLMPIQLDDLRVWLRRLGLARHEIDRAASDLLDEVLRQFGDSRFSYLNDALNRLYEKYLNQSPTTPTEPLS